MLARLVQALVATLALVGAVTLVVAGWLASGGISARTEPGPLERTVARRLHSYAIPGEARARSSPVPTTQETISEGMEHFADHCATCHANDGSGKTDLGQGLYPRAPDMRREQTQRLSDGELFYIIENGVRLTGMPAWGNGTPPSEAASWHLVQFIRHLPKLTPDEIERMKALNPQSPEQRRQEEEERQFLEGERVTPPSAHPRHSHPGEDDD